MLALFQNLSLSCKDYFKWIFIHFWNKNILKLVMIDFKNIATGGLVKLCLKIQSFDIIKNPKEQKIGNKYYV